MYSLSKLVSKLFPNFSIARIIPSPIFIPWIFSTGSHRSAAKAWRETRRIRNRVMVIILHMCVKAHPPYFPEKPAPRVHNAESFSQNRLYPHILETLWLLFPTDKENQLLPAFWLYGWIKADLNS